MKNSLLILCIFIFQFALSQNRAPSCWLKYQDNFQGDILINKIKVISPSPTYTYYCSLQWNAGMEGGGYCGIQEHPDGRNFIFSIWDPISSSESITAPYTHSGTQVESFGGEGTGLKSWNFTIGWDTEQWYSFVTRAWSFGSNTMFGFWVYSHFDQIWYHLVTMDYPVSNIRFNSPTGSFIEDWLGNGWNTREVHHQDGWKRKTSDLSWNALKSSLFERVSPDAGANNYINNYDGGTNSDYYFMRSGGTTTPTTNTSGTMLSLANINSEPGYDVANVSSINKTVSIDNLLLNWTLDPSKSPQFSYKINIYDNPALSGVPLIEINEIIPHQRDSNIDISSLTNGIEYYIEFSVIDIFDNQSTTVTESFVAQSSTLGLNDTNIINTFNYYPNPFDSKIYLNFKNQIKYIKITLTDITGKIILMNNYYNCSEIEIKTPSDIGKGIYFLTVTDEKQNKNTIKLVKK
jgi:hypothetical protein